MGLRPIGTKFTTGMMSDSNYPAYVIECEVVGHITSLNRETGETTIKEEIKALRIIE